VRQNLLIVSCILGLIGCSHQEKPTSIPTVVYETPQPPTLKYFTQSVVPSIQAQLLPETTQECENNIWNDYKHCVKVSSYSNVMITNIYSSGGCPDDLFVFVNDKWFLFEPRNGTGFRVDAHLLVPYDATLFLGEGTKDKHLHTDMKCTITFSGYFKE
jgi:hypothetical protein